jgi:hypothetical protein
MMSKSSLMQYISKEEFEGEQPDEVVQEMGLEIPEVQPDVTEEVVAEAVEDAEFEGEEEAELADGIDEAGAALTEANDEVAAIEHFTTLLEHGLKHKQFNPQFAVLCQEKMGSLSEKLGVAPKVSLEHYGAKDLEAFYTASLETFTGLGKRIGDIGRRVNEAIDSGINNALFTSGRKKAVKAINAQADALITELGNATFEGTVEVSAKGVAKDLAVGKQFPSNLVGAVSTDQKLTSTAATAGFNAVTKYMNDLSGCIDGATTAGGPGKTGEWAKKAAGLATPFKAFPSDLYSEGLMGGLVLEGDEKGNSGDTRSDIRSIGKKALPTVGSNRGASGASTVSLTKADVTKLIQSAKVYGAMADKLVTTGNNNLLANLRKNTEKYQRWATSGDTATWSESKDIGYIVDQMPTVIWRHFQIYRALTNHCIDTAEALLKLAKQAVKAAK